MLPDGWYFDSVAFWILNALMLWDGIQRVPAGAWVLRHVAGNAWQVAQEPRETAGRRLVSWLSPVVCHVVLSPGPGTGRTPPARLGRWTALVRVPAFLALVAIVIGVPLLTPTHGVLGLAGAVAAALAASLLTALVSAIALWRMGLPFRAAARHSIGIVSPFTAPRAPEIVLAKALEGVAFADAVRALLPADAWAAWARPLAYDVSRGVAPEGVAELLPAGDAQAILRLPPPGSVLGDVYCARCGRVYLPSATACHACEGAELVTVDEAALRVEPLPAPVPRPVPALVGAPTASPAPRGKGKGRGKSHRQKPHPS